MKKRPTVNTTADMSPEAIDHRLRELGQLYKLAMELRHARWVGPLKETNESAKKSAPSDPHGTLDGISS